MQVIILCKAPIAGRVKTRLMPAYSDVEAAKIHQQMTETVLRKTTLIFDDVWLAVDDVSHPFFAKMKLKYHFNLCFQGDGNLGERLKHLMHQSLIENNVQKLMFLGTDSPHIPLTRYQQAITQSQGADILIGPVEDGGYDLIVIKQSLDYIFEGITWGSEHVLEQTLHICKQYQHQVELLDISFDLDRAEDLQRAPIHTWFDRES